jgi:predicted amidophosphoribosyltransferase
VSLALFNEVQELADALADLCPLCGSDLPLTEDPCPCCVENAAAWRREMLALDRVLPQEGP